MAKQAQRVMLAQAWGEEVDPSGWWMSEKLDGVRAYWSGSNFYSRQGNLFYAPEWFGAGLPDCPLDGELWCGRGLFQKCVSIVKKKKNVIEEDWNYVTYLVFDAPSLDLPYEKRIQFLQKAIPSSSSHAAVVGVQKCKDVAHLQETLRKVENLGGEGLMLRRPGSLYEWGPSRSSTLLKVKSFHDEEALVIGHKRGTGRCLNMMGHLECRLPNGLEFSIGTGFSDAQRKKPPKIGSVITFKYQELSNSGNPRFPVYLRERTDMTWEDVLEAAKTKTPFSQIPKKQRALKRQHSIMFSTLPTSASASLDVDEGMVEEGSASSSSSSSTSKTVTKSTTKVTATATTATTAPKKKKCMYGAACYRKDPLHLSTYSHETSAASTSTTNVTAASSSASEERDDAVKVPCKWGAECYLTKPDHLRKYSHPPKDQKEKKAEEEEEEEAEAGKEGLNEDSTLPMEDFYYESDDEIKVEVEEELILVNEHEGGEQKTGEEEEEESGGSLHIASPEDEETVTVTKREWTVLQAALKNAMQRIEALETWMYSDKAFWKAAPLETDEEAEGNEQKEKQKQKEKMTVEDEDEEDKTEDRKRFAKRKRYEQN
ncbi:3-ketoacyl-CoA synthase 17 [Balamuthia mandrillaris]